MKTLIALVNTRRDAIIGVLLFALALALYSRTLAPSIVFLFDDTLEMQYVVPRLGIVHPTGYPLYTLLGKLFTLIVPINDAAFRLNLFSAFCAALAVVFVYLVAQRLTTHRLAAVFAALTFAVGDTFWAQAVAAEVYALQMLLAASILFLTLRLQPPISNRALYALAFAMGLGLTHHRLIVLLFPAIAIYVFLIDQSILRDWKTLARATLFLLLPLSFYLYLPLRGNVGSADGTYENSLTGFFSWVMASQYTPFLTENPLQVTRDAADYWTMFQTQFTLAGLAFVAIGFVTLVRKPREWMLLIVALITTAGFAFNYKTDDVQVHFLTTFLLLALFLSVGIDGLLSILSQFTIRNFQFILHPSSFILLLIIPIYLLQSNYTTNDLSQKWDVYDYGIDILSQPLANNATIIGITGEMTLIRYFQEQRALRPDVQTISADTEDARLAAIETALRQNRAVYLTRQLKGAAERYSLSSIGPLIRVNPAPVSALPALAEKIEQDFGAVKLVGYTVQMLNEQRTESGRALRITLYWHVKEKIETDAMVSVKVMRSDRRIFGQSDHRPVLGAYPTTAWRVGEIVADAYAVPVFFGATPSEYTINVTLYDAQSSAVIGQHDLRKLKLATDLTAPRRDLWNIARIVDADFGALSLVGYSLNLDAPMRPGDALPLTLLWRASWQSPGDNLMTRLWLEDATGKQVASRDTLLSLGYPPFQWTPHSYVRDFAPVRLPANIADGEYVVKLAVSRNNELLGSTLLPFFPTVVDLGPIEIKNRVRTMTAPIIPRALEATFDRKIKLLGYDLKIDSPGAAQLTLYWRTLALMDTPYTIFVHLLDAQNRVLATGDAEPGNGAFPTTGWIENEYIVDVHTVLFGEVASGTYSIAIGVYDPATGARLKTVDDQDRILIRNVEFR